MASPTKLTPPSISSATSIPSSSAANPLIPERFLDVPSQRLYYLSLGLLCQAVKVFDFLLYITSVDSTSHLCRKWLIVDFTYCFLLSRLRIPRLSYSVAVVILQIALLWFFDGVLFGGVSLNTPFRTGDGGSGHGGAVGGRGRGDSSSRYDFSATPEPFSLLDWIAPLSFGLLSPSPAGLKDSHLLGQHTVRMSPISTAQLNPQAQVYCIAPSTEYILIPLLLNNTNPAHIRYTITPLGRATGNAAKQERVDLAAKDIKVIEQARIDALHLTRSPNSSESDDDYDEYDYDDEEDASSGKNDAHSSSLQKTQSLVHVKISRPGVLHLERVVDFAGIDARLAFPSEVKVVPCPRVEFVEEKSVEEFRCAAEQPLHLNIDLFGVPPLSLRWSQTVNGRKESFLVEGIEGGHDDDDGDSLRSQAPSNDDDSEHEASSDSAEHAHDAVVRHDRAAENVRIPLTIPLDTIGTYAIALQEITDSVGNVVRVDLPGNQSSKSLRSLHVLRKPTVSFRHCRPGAPASLLIGSEASLAVSLKDVDDMDAPWDVMMKYTPPSPVDSEEVAQRKKGGKNTLKSWKKTLTTQGEGKELTIKATAPGEYTILGVKGKWCLGEVLAPESCKVVEKPLPTALIEWKKIHECSGDTGVSASLVLHGTPPFQVYYRIQRNSEAPRELSKTFASSRGELTLQPDRSGHYTFSFVQMSDANYKKVELKGPSIEQAIHPLAAADFAGQYSGSGSGGGGGVRSKRVISSCEGDLVDVDVDLKGTGPWSLEVLVVGPKNSETIHIQGIESARKTLQIPIPAAINKEGGSFEIDLVSVEDAHKCKRQVSVPGITVSVKRIKPTIKFYGEEAKRHITVLEHETAKLPLRLTGDGPWRIKYRRESDPHMMSATLTNPNDHLEVKNNGVYELISISDSQCPGSLVPGYTTYRVDWTPRPIAKLSANIKATFEPANGSYILPPVCEGMDDHVDLDLTGRPPFQIMYNVAQQVADSNGIKLLDQPTFNSIQPRTRFQLHTSEPGRIYYEVKQIGDAAYPLAKHANAVIPRSERLLFEQQVSRRPSARFKNRNRLSYCLNDAFTAEDGESSGSGGGVIVLEGTPPYTLHLSIKDLATSHVESRTLEIRDGSEWKLDLPSYMFESIGPHLVKIESVADASGCAQQRAMGSAVGGSGGSGGGDRSGGVHDQTSTIWVDVMETAAIVPFNDRRREHLCVGEVSQFQLEGTPPWSIGYRINGRSYTQEAKVSPFSLLHQQAGEFTVTSVAHQQKRCRAAVTDLRFEVHPLPSAQVGHGKKIYQDIHEGDQAEIVFTLIGEPPFAFTYQRSEPSPKKGGKPGRVLETHTVSRVLTNEYSIFSASEGTWTVTSITDKYCRYPLSHPELEMQEKARPGIDFTGGSA